MLKGRVVTIKIDEANESPDMENKDAEPKPVSTEDITTAP
jgi:hypothetical protein